ncbi:KTSC domain-containing protein [Muricauda sp. CAU 1633]|uniref:KTSC domain-containing protein n=1 Tax=Allomuricauda sp. CAU 1633 TaxID=2816036 RepID=UPI001A8EFD31|nr:KTSC domain-containing protein [Muricauda sp. CAU 1633]MBO0323184.1 KTSC domain-containing protein [Muricauda sp. CAU 1633]
MSYPEMIPVVSSNIESIGYEEQSQQVFVKFLKGGVYVYKGVPESEYQNLLVAPSVGSYLHRNFKNVYPYERIE